MTANERKALIFSVAEGLFGARGCEKVTMSEIAAQVGMSKRTLYVLFPDKGELLKALVASSYIWPEEAFEAGAGDPVAQLRLRLGGMAEHALSERHVRLCRLACRECAGTAGLAEAFLDRGIAASRTHLIQVIETIPKARRKLDLPAPLLADMLYGATCGFRLMQALLTGCKPAQAEVEAAIALVMDALFI
ncbi:MAG TPA: TetR/AcrR family transcriptional regulator [Acidocella sp.]|nr:TetR/AcrR family transcriptional regulator [Acidocella sp.]